MLRATLDQMRSSAGRLAAAGLAILLGTAFVAAALLASATMQQATEDAFTASYADADLVVSTDSEPVSRDRIPSPCSGLELDALKLFARVAGCPGAVGCLALRPLSAEDFYDFLPDGCHVVFFHTLVLLFNPLKLCANHR